MKFAVIGAGVTGLATALELSKSGHNVTIIERDQTPMPKTCDEAFEWDRRGAPQVRHSHALLGRLHNILRDNHPEVLKSLLDSGVTEINLIDHMPKTLDDRQILDEDINLRMLAARRTTFEWVLRNTVMKNTNVQLRTGLGVTGVKKNDSVLPKVIGLHFNDGKYEDFDCVIAANGRRSQAPQWLRDAGIRTPDEVVEDTGIIYYSRFYRLPDGVDLPVGDRLVAGDLGYLKYGVFWGDNGTFSITFATSDTDKTFWGIRDVDVFESVVDAIPAAKEWISLAPEPITEVHSMAGLLNRKRSLKIEGKVVVDGFHMIGDALVCTNPLYGRGCSTGFWQAHLLADAIRDHGSDSVAQSESFLHAVEGNIIPWYQASVDSDRGSRAIADGVDDEMTVMKRSILKEGLMPATQTSSKVWRGFMKMMNLLADPSILSEPEISAEIMKVWADRDQRNQEAPIGPSREGMIDHLKLTNVS